MFTKIFFSAKPLYLCDSLTAELTLLKTKPNTAFTEGSDYGRLSKIVCALETDDYNTGIILSKDLEVLKDAFFANFTIIKAAGGLVINEEDKVLVIYRKGKWDLPKGKMEPEETIEECAIREVQEETGIEQVEMTKPLTITYHTYFEKNVNILKESHWYEMRASSTEILSPQTEEDIVEIKWVAAEELALLKTNMFASIIDVLELAGRFCEVQ